jgi:hypothetical protein
MLACSYKDGTQIGSEISLARDNFIIAKVLLAEVRACLGEGQLVLCLAFAKWEMYKFEAYRITPRESRGKTRLHTHAHIHIYSTF